MNEDEVGDNSMGLLAFGLNHRTAPLDVRERLAYSPESVDEALQTLKQQAQLSEVAILSTCNRTDYFCATRPSNFGELKEWICQRHQINPPQLVQSTYEYWNLSAVRHMMRVASGLDSMVLGEPEILGQMKTAYSTAKQAATLGPELSRAFESAFSVAKHVRTETKIGVNPVSVASTAVLMAKRIFSDLSNSKVLLIGAGETIELVARHLKQQNVDQIIVANRTIERAQALGAEFDALPITLEEIPNFLSKVDIVVSSTAAPLPILGKGMVEKAIKQRRHSPIFMIDIAVPRDIEEAVGDLEDVYLYTVDDLQSTVEENLRARQEVASEAEAIVQTRSSEFIYRLKQLDATETVKNFRQKIDQLREVELQKAQQSLAAGADPALVLEKLSRNLANKMMHEPSLVIKKASAEGRNDMIDYTHELFGLDKQNTTPSNNNDE